ncbi:MAG: two-component regulator propeller domain-containing protein, partial [Anaerolineales bacterium]
RFRANPDDPYSLSHDAVEGVYRDPTGLLWLGTRGGGVGILDLESKAFRHYYSIPGDTSTLNNNDVLGIYGDSDDVLWIGTGSGGLNKFDIQAQQVNYYQYDPIEPEGIADNMVREIVQDSQGILWLATRQGLNRFDPGTRETNVYQHDPDDPSSLMHTNTFTVYLAKDGAIWVGTRGGPNRLDSLTGETSAYPQYQELEDILDVMVLSIAEDAAGMIWMGTGGGGLIRFDPLTEQFAQYRHNIDDPDSLVDNFIWNLFFDSAGNLWIGTAAGLDRFDADTGRFVHFNVKDGLPPAAVMSILQDDLPAEAGGPNLWISTTKGLTKFNPESGTVRNYDSSDGLQGDDFVWSSAFKNQHGELFFGGTNGITAFNPSQIEDNPHIPPIIITDFQLAGKSVEISNDSILEYAIHETEYLNLSHKDQVISFEFAALNYRAPEKNRYRYMMEGFDADWIEVGSDRRFVTYTNLDPGDYVFRVIGSNNDGVWNEDGTAIKITITPPWWGTVWAIGIFLLMIVVGMFGAYRWRLSSLESRGRSLEAQIEKQTSQLDQRIKELDTLLSVTRNVTSTLELEPLLYLILDELKNVVEYDVAVIRRLKYGSMELLAYRGISQDDDPPSPRLPVEKIPIIKSMIQTNQAFVANGVQSNPEVFGDFEEFEETISRAVLDRSRTLMGVPLTVKNEVIGMLVLGHQEPDCYDSEIMALVQAFANQASVAIVNAELYEKAAELATMEERTRLARELHDSATQSLYSATLFGEAGKELTERGDTESANYYQSRVGEEVYQALKDLRLLVFQLRPPVLEKEGLVGAIQKRLDSVENRAGMETRLVGDPQVTMPDEVSEDLYAIALEALNNVLKHAESDSVTVSIHSIGDMLTLEVVDDGRGFDPESGEDSGGMGLRNIRDRVDGLDGDLTIASALDEGTSVKVTIPWTELTTNPPRTTGDF